VCVGPANPGVDAGVDVERKGVTTDRDGAEDFDSCEAHKPDVSAGGKVVVAGQEFVELRSTLVEVYDAQDGVDGRNDTDGDWRAEYKDVSNPGVVGEGPAANIFENVVTMALGDIICQSVLEGTMMEGGKERHTKNHSQHRNAYSDSEVDGDSSALLRPGNRHRFYRCNLIETAIDAEGSRRNSEGSPNPDFGGWEGMRNKKKIDSKRNVQISHQMGAQSMALPFQTMELINWVRQATPVHAM